MLIVPGTSNFLTDADISGNLALRERELQRWEPTSDSTVDLSLNGARGTWDQFETNERLYGLKTNYDENIYTTSIDRSHPSYKERAAAADRLVREIEGSTTTNLHVAEERGFLRDDSGIDEEDRFAPQKSRSSWWRVSANNLTGSVVLGVISHH